MSGLPRQWTPCCISPKATGRYWVLDPKRGIAVSIWWDHLDVDQKFWTLLGRAGCFWEKHEDEDNGR